MDSHKPLTAGELEIDCGAFGKIKRASPPVKGDFAIQDGRLTLLGCIQRGLVTLSREELLPFLDAMDAQDAQIRTLNERIIELDLEVMEKCRRIDSLLTPPPDAAVREAVDVLREDYEMYCPQPDHDPTKNYYARVRWWAVVTILRAVQAPRLTGEQVEAVKAAHARLMAYACPEDEDAGEGLVAAFPEAFAGEVGRGE